MQYEELYGREKLQRKRQNAQRSSQLKRQKLLKIKKRRRRRAILFTIEVLALAALIAGVYFTNLWGKIKKADFQASDIQTNDGIDTAALEKMEGFTTFAIFGVDAKDNDTLESGTRTDVIMIVRIDNATGEVRLSSIYRDTYLQRADSGEYGKVNAAYQSGADNALSTLNINLDLKIQKFVTVNWKAVAETIDLLGGIELTIENELLSLTERNLNGYIEDICLSTGLKSDFIYSPGTYNCTGVQAVAYCRMRYADVDGFAIGDYGRTQRQRIVIEKMIEKAKKADILQLNDIANQIFPQIYTNFDLSEIMTLLGHMSNFSLAETMGFPVDRYDDGSSIYPASLESNVIVLHDFLFGGTEEGYSPSERVQQLSQQIINICGHSEPQ